MCVPPPYLPQPVSEGGQESSGHAVLKTKRAGPTRLLQVIQVCSQMDRQILSLETLEPNLETVFLHLTGSRSGSEAVMVRVV